MDSVKIEKDKIVSMDYEMKDEDGNVLENTEETGPGEFLVGHSQLMPAVEEALADKTVGDAVTVDLAPDQAFGERHEELVEKIDRDKFSKEMPMEIGHQFEVPASDGQPMIVRVVDLTDSQVTFDSNHPLAGKSLSFTATVREVRDATDLEIEHGHPLAEDGCCGGGCGGH